MAMKSEYLLNPYHGQEHPWSVRNKSTKKEVSMKKVRTLQDILEKLEAEDIDPRTVVVNPKAISVVSDSDDDDSDKEKEDE